MTSHHLAAAETPPGVLSETTWQAGALILGFGLSIPVFFITTGGWVLWFAIPLLAGQLRRYQRRHRHPLQSPDPPGPPDPQHTHR